MDGVEPGGRLALAVANCNRRGNKITIRGGGRKGTRWEMGQRREQTMEIRYREHRGKRIEEIISDKGSGSLGYAKDLRWLNQGRESMGVTIAEISSSEGVRVSE